MRTGMRGGGYDSGKKHGAAEMARHTWRCSSVKSLKKESVHANDGHELANGIMLNPLQTFKQAPPGIRMVCMSVQVNVVAHVARIRDTGCFNREYAQCALRILNAVQPAIRITQDQRLQRCH